jgi:hypothetical protein
MNKGRITLSLGRKEAEKLKKLKGYASGLVSFLLEEFFLRVSIDDVWRVMEMEKLLDEQVRIEKLRRLVKEVFSSHYGSPPQEGGGPAVKKAWKKFG